MIVCVCEGISESEVKVCIRAGATTLDLIEATCGAGSCCQSCHPELLSLIHEETLTDHRPIERSFDRRTNGH